MQVWLYKRKYDKKYVHPDLGTHKVIDNCVFKEAGSLDVVHPVVKFTGESIDLISDMNGYNYMYIPQLRSWYWMNWHSENGVVVLEGERDALYTFWGDIKETTQYVTRAEHSINRYIVDNNLPIHSDHNYYMKKIGNPVYLKNCNNVILETVGKGGTPT